MIRLPSVRVWRDNPRRAKIINAADFDPARHELFEPATGGAKEIVDAKIAAAAKKADHAPVPATVEPSEINPETDAALLREASDRRAQQQASGAAFDHDGDGKAGGSAKPADPDGDLKALRASYRALVGKRPFAGWDAATLREKIAAHRGSS